MVTVCIPNGKCTKAFTSLKIISEGLSEAEIATLPVASPRRSPSGVSARSKRPPTVTDELRRNISAAVTFDKSSASAVAGGDWGGNTFGIRKMTKIHVSHPYSKAELSESNKFW